MKYCVMHNLSFETPAKRNELEAAIQNNIVGKQTWGAVSMQSGTDEEGHPLHSLAIRFQNRADMDELFTLIKNKLDAIPVLKGKVSKHNCSHDEGTVHPCQITEEYSKG